MASSLQTATIGQGSTSAAILLLTWAEHQDLVPTAELLLALLHEESARSDHLSIVLRRLAEAEPLLLAWAEDGAELYGLASLAARLIADRAFLDTLPGRIEPLVHASLDDLYGQADSHYLLACWTARQPVEASSAPWVDVLRTWTLVEAMRCADFPGVPLRDQLVLEVCQRLRHASEEGSAHPWLDAIEKLRPHSFDKWITLRDHLRETSKVLAGSAAQGTQKKFFRYLNRLAAGDRAPLRREGESEATYRIVGLIRQARDAPVLPELPEHDVDPDDPAAQAITVLPLQDSEDSLDDDELGLIQVATDPEESVAEQELRGRYIQLLSGADARYLAWDWYCLTPPERLALDQHIERSLEGPGHGNLIAALVWIALATGRSLQMTSRLAIRQSTQFGPGRDWAVDVTGRVLYRPAPRRAGHWVPRGTSAQFVCHDAGTLARALDHRVAKLLASAATPSTTTLGGLWHASSGRPLTEAFRDWIAIDPGLRRITQGMLSQGLGRQALNATQDHVLTRLVSSTPDAGLPASTAYTAYQVGDQAISALGVVGPGDAVNLAGSRLDPVPGMLKAGFQAAHAEVTRLARGPSFVEFHNAVARYWDAVLCAATGVRPHAERWLDFRDVDESLGFIVVNDKAGLGTRRTRLVPWPTGLLARFRDSYLQGHLLRLRSWLAEAGVQMPAVSPSSRADPLNFLFLLVPQVDGLSAVPVSRAPSGDALCPEGPLPRRVFRHWLRTELHRRGADTEVIDSLFGHLDGATATHGDHSMRVWARDMRGVQPHLDAAFESLEIGDLPQPTPDALFDPPSALRIETDTARSPAPGATLWRTRMRAARKAAAILSRELRRAEEQVVPDRRFLLSDLSRRVGAVEVPEKLDDLGKQLMLGSRNSPATLGPMRYAFFMRLVERAWAQHATRPPLRRRLMVRVSDDSPFDRAASGALRRRALAIECFQRVVADRPPSRVSASQATWFAAIDLMLSSRCTDPALRARIVANGGYRLVHHAKRTYLEWNPAGEVNELDAPVMRLRVSPVTAVAALRLLQAGQQRVKDSSPVDPVFAELASVVLGQTSGVTFGRLLDELVHITDQCNAIELPGLVAAYLAGRLRSASLHWGDWLALRGVGRRDVRLLKLQVTPRGDKSSSGPKAASAEPADAGTGFESPSGLSASSQSVRAKSAENTSAARGLAPFRLVHQVDQTDTAGDDVPPPHARLASAKDVKRAEAQLAARQFFKLLRAELNRDKSAPASASLSRKRPSDASLRRDIQRAIGRHCRTRAASVSSAVIALGQWAASLLDRRHGAELVRLSTVRRYLSALSPRFEAAGSTTDLLAMDGEEIEEFYLLLLGLRMGSRRLFPADRLRDFHRFAKRQLGLPDIDWSEVLPDQESQLCAPGLVEESAFRWLLIALARSPVLETADGRLAAQGIAILTYRAGLRVTEASGLLSDDLYLDTRLTWVAVDKNRLRGLKSLAARRTVPMPHLRPRERRVLERLVDNVAQAMRGLPGQRFLFGTSAGSGGAVNVEAVM